MCTKSCGKAVGCVGRGGKKLSTSLYQGARPCHVAVPNTNTRNEYSFGFDIGFDFAFHPQGSLVQSQCCNTVRRKGPDAYPRDIIFGRQAHPQQGYRLGRGIHHAPLGNFVQKHRRTPLTEVFRSFTSLSLFRRVAVMRQCHFGRQACGRGRFGRQDQRQGRRWSALVIFDRMDRCVDPYIGYQPMQDTLPRIRHPSRGTTTR
eukprot:scaffold9684_cov194-Amphora_coffeaeformis.AAC.2